MLGIFSTDLLKKQFGKLRQGSRETYFITVQEIFEKVSISKEKLLLNLNCDAVDKKCTVFEIEPVHHCQKCSFTLTEQMCDILDCLSDMQASVSKDSIASFVYVAGYLTVKAKIKI